MAGTGQHRSLTDDNADSALRRSRQSIDLEESVPPPPGSTRDSPTDPWVIEQIGKARADSKLARKLAEEAHGWIADLRKAIGRSPEPAKNEPGEGMLGRLHDVTVALDKDREDRTRRAQNFSIAWKAIAGTVAVVGGIFGILAKLLHW